MDNMTHTHTYKYNKHIFMYIIHMHTYAQVYRSSTVAIPGVLPGRMRDWELEEEDIDITYGGVFRLDFA